MKLKNVLAGFFVLSSLTCASEPFETRTVDLRTLLIEELMEGHEPFLVEVVATSLRRLPRMNTSFQEVNNELSKLIDLNALPGASK